MNCISLWQPWATLWASGHKIHETRHWPYPARLLGETLGIHAAKRKDPEARELCSDGLFKEVLASLGYEFDTLPFGAIVGAVDVVASLKTEDVYTVWDGHEEDDFYFGNYEPGRFAWKGENALMLYAPIPFKGAQGFFEIPRGIAFPAS